MTALVFDLDGVLCRSGYFTAPLERQFGIRRSRWGDFFTAVMPACIVGRLDLKDELARYLPQLGWSGTVDELLQFWFKSEEAVCPDLSAFVAQQRRQGTRCYIATNQERHRASYISTVMGLERSFDRLFYSCELRAAKPSRDFFEKVYREIAAPDVCLIDDSAENVRAAESLGWRTVHYRGPQDIGRISNYINCDERR
jgi:putative hydrolase of the HAD superfamily